MFWFSSGDDDKANSDIVCQWRQRSLAKFFFCSFAEDLSEDLEGKSGVNIRRTWESERNIDKKKKATFESYLSFHPLGQFSNHHPHPFLLLSLYVPDLDKKKNALTVLSKQYKTLCNCLQGRWPKSFWELW